MPHARSSTRECAASPSVTTHGVAPAAVEPERDQPVHALVAAARAGRTCASTDRRFSSPCGKRAVVAEHRRGHARLPTGLAARGGELARVADRLEVLLRDLEQQLTEVVGDERGDGGQQRAERVDEALGLLVVGERRCRATAAARARRTSRPRRSAIARVRRRGAASPARAGRGAGSRPRAAAGPSAARRRPRRCSPRAPSRCWGTTRPSRAMASSSGAGMPTRAASSSRSSSVGVAVLRAGDRGGERLVGGVELAGEQAADDREREALALEVLDAAEPVDVLVAVPGDAPLAAGRREQLALLVEADGVDRHVGAPGELLDADPPSPGSRGLASARSMSADSRSDHSRDHPRPPDPGSAAGRERGAAGAGRGRTRRGVGIGEGVARRVAPSRRGRRRAA